MKRVAFSPDGSHLAAAGVLGVELWDLGAVDEPVQLDSRTDLKAIAFSPDGAGSLRLPATPFACYDPKPGA